MAISVVMQRNYLTYQFGEAGFGGGLLFPVYITGTVNWGAAQYKQIYTRKPFQNGDTYVGFQLEPRVLQIPIFVPASSPEDMMTKRFQLSKVFTYADDEVSLIVSWSDDTGTYKRQIRGHIVGGLEFDTDSKHTAITSVIQIKANDPTWAENFLDQFVINGVIAGTPTLYPKVYPVLYGDNVINKTNYITYNGSWDAYPTIRINGPVSNLTMVDTLGHVIKFNDTIPAGAIWTVDLSYGVYTITDQDGVNRFSSLDISSNLVDWRIYAASTIVPSGINTVSISGTGATGATYVILEYYTRYIGV